MKWDSKKSVVLSLACNRALMVLALGAAGFVLWPLGRFSLMLYVLESRCLERLAFIPVPAEVLIAGMALACIAVALLALWRLDALLRNIRRGEVFIRRNVSALRGISWCCFGEAALLAMNSLLYCAFFMFFTLAVMAGFVGIILRVVKNVIEAAVLLKEENDLTI